MARTKFRLAIVLRAQKRPTEAEKVRQEALKMLVSCSSTARDSETQREYTDKDDMELFDRSVTLWHGRTTGIWSAGVFW